MPLTQETVRTVMLTAQGLLTPPETIATKADLLPVIRQMGYLQIDTLQVVRRSQDVILRSRLGDYEVDWLDELHAEGRLDPKAHRKEKHMEIRKIYLEPDIAITNELATDLRNTLEAFTAWHSLETLNIQETDPMELWEALV